MKFTALLAVIGTAAAVTIAEINGDSFISPLNGTAATGVEGLVIAKASNGIYLRSTTPDDDDATSDAIFVFGSSVAGNVNVGDVISLNGRVQEFRSNPDYIYMTEITSPRNVVVQSSGNDVSPLVIGEDTLSPPTEQYSSLDGGDVFGLPNAVTNISIENPRLDPTKYGLDFWESLSGELVNVKNPVAIARPNNFGDTWIRGDWPVSGLNGHGGLTMTDKGKQMNANPETIIIGSPLDGSKNPSGTKMGDELADITGIVTYAFGFYRILPLTAIEIASPADATVSPTRLESQGSCKGITMGDYNAENLSPESDHLPLVASQIVDYLKTPDIVFLQEVQDNSGPADDGVVSANATLEAVVSAVEGLSGVAYAYVDVDPVNDRDGGQPGGNIRVAYLYRPDVVELYKPNLGGSLDANEVLLIPGGPPELKFNPGRIDPENSAWDNSRKPVAAMWRTVKDEKESVFFTVNVHFSSKGGSTTLHGDARPPINGALEARGRQVEVAGKFIAEILAADSKAKVIAAGDFNEFSFVKPMQTFASISGLVDSDAAAALPEVERYTYRFDMSSQALDHIYISPALQDNVDVEHLHLSTWADEDGMVSDHDPSVIRLNVCESKRSRCLSSRQASHL